MTAKRDLPRPVEVYTPERKAGFLLNNAVTAEDRARAVKEVRRMGREVCRRLGLSVRRSGRKNYTIDPATTSRSRNKGEHARA